MRCVFAMVLSLGGAVPAPAATHNEPSLSSPPILQMMCIPVGPEEVSVVPHGFYIRTLDEFVRYDHVLPSMGGYMLCKSRDMIKLFAPQRAL